MARDLVLDPDNVIQLWTRNGPCEIQLLSGDITRMQMEDKVDIIMVSAFPGDYAPMSGTVIGALKKNLGIDVRQLSYDKELDLRHSFSCWLSKPIPQDTPFKKLVCFERVFSRVMPGGFDSTSVIQQIREMFRVFVPIFNNQDNTVITPLLATGHQSHDRVHVCGTMVEAAAHWINAGLPLRRFKIVIYEGVDGKVKTLFQGLKNKLMAKNAKMKTKIFTKKFDVFITFNPTDTTLVKKIQTRLTQTKTDIKLHAEGVTFQEDKLWQDDIFKEMVSCKRIIAVLSPAFMQSAECLELYNMALCCNRLLGVNVLAPFYVETVKDMPTYMGLVQWIDCRIRQDKDTLEGKIEIACSMIVTAIDKPQSKEQPTVSSAAVTGTKSDKVEYDVFISYSHKTPKHAEDLLNTFKNVDENIKVFYDRSALTTGSNWQSMLYNCLGECKCVIALLSPAYMSSTVCMEEYNLALARFLSKDNSMQFIPVCIETLDELPTSMSKVKVRYGIDDFVSIATEVATLVCGWIKDPEYKTDVLNHMDEPMDIEEVFSAERTQALNKQYKLVRQRKEDWKYVRQIPLTLQKREDETINKEVDIVLSYANDSMHLAGTFCSIADELYPGLNINSLTDGEHKRLKALDEAKQIVIFVSQEFLKTEFHMQELHLALCRQRQSSENILYLIKTTNLYGHPFFPRILPYVVACEDEIWEEHEIKFLKVTKKGKTENKTMITRKRDSRMNIGNYVCSYGQYFAMTKTVEDVLDTIVFGNGVRTITSQILLNPLVVAQGAHVIPGHTSRKSEGTYSSKDREEKTSDDDNDDDVESIKESFLAGIRELEKEFEDELVDTEDNKTINNPTASKPSATSPKTQSKHQNSTKSKSQDANSSNNQESEKTSKSCIVL